MSFRVVLIVRVHADAVHHMGVCVCVGVGCELNLKRMEKPWGVAYMSCT